jgi:arylsulfatase A-like enzyme
MTGRLSFKYGYYSNPGDAAGVPTNYTMLPQVLQQQGYRTHALGKWHCGFRTPAHTPTQRGFESFLGYWRWGEEYNDHVFPPYDRKTSAACQGIDFSNLTDDGQMDVVAGLNGTKSATVFVREFERIVAAHPDDAPLYVYFAFQNAHDPYESAPPELGAAGRGPL